MMNKVDLIKAVRKGAPLREVSALGETAMMPSLSGAQAVGLVNAAIAGDEEAASLVREYSGLGWQELDGVLRTLRPTPGVRRG